MTETMPTLKDSKTALTKQAPVQTQIPKATPKPTALVAVLELGMGIGESVRVKLEQKRPIHAGELENALRTLRREVQATNRALRNTPREQDYA